ncbi:rhodanese domain-containing protein CG4456 [Scaptodrosophila lebanonensis]|uniref:Rhodanese domain-containing protein CG4456 n=1 Tax=Drosophila lebanonensis TaxID=7225 RepID=A0A6J2T707_DROLE|nr:rhodanese domain-containing protein CG4456 [Scaptodrosophila lebanonensis]
MFLRRGVNVLRAISTNCCRVHRTGVRNLTGAPVSCRRQLELVNISSGCQRYYSSGSQIGIVDYAEVKKLANEPQKLLIDVREPDELKETGQIPSSINIPLGIVGQELVENAKLFKSKYGREKPSLETEIIFHCKMGMRSQKAAEAAATLGFKNVKNYKGSWVDWAEREGLSK